MALQYPRQSGRAAPAATVVGSQGPSAPPAAASRTPTPVPPSAVAAPAAVPPPQPLQRNIVASSCDAPPSGSIGRWVIIGVMVLLGVLVVVFGVFLHQTHTQVQRLQTAQNAALNTDEVREILREQVGPVMQQFGQQQTALQNTQRQIITLQQSLSAISEQHEALQEKVTTLKMPRTRRAITTGRAVDVSSGGAPAATPTPTPRQVAANPQAALLSSLIQQTATSGNVRASTHTSPSIATCPSVCPSPSPSPSLQPTSTASQRPAIPPAAANPFAVPPLTNEGSADAILPVSVDRTPASASQPSSSGNVAIAEME